MSVFDPKTVAAQIKKGELQNLYYIFGEDTLGTEKLTKFLVKAAVGENEDIALTRINGRYIDFSELSENLQMMPMTGDYNCILIQDYNCEKPLENMSGKKSDTLNKQLIDILKEIPPYAIVVISITGFDVQVKYNSKTRTYDVSDKNKKLADFAAKNGVLCQVRKKTPQELAAIIQSKVQARGGMIYAQSARLLAEMCLCDEMTIENETEKLCSYAAGREIDDNMVRLLVTEQNDITVYKLADAVARLDSKAAFDAIEKLDIDDKNRGSALYAIAGTFTELYRAAAAVKSGVPAAQVAADFSYAPNRKFLIEKSMRECSKIGIERLRNCILILRDTAYKLNTSGIDSRTAIEQAVTRMLIVNERRS